jgi:flagellar biosynthesis/type III secretory pathway M-ring protein FliF/YscJ
MKKIQQGTLAALFLVAMTSVAVLCACFQHQTSKSAEQAKTPVIEFAIERTNEAAEIVQTLREHKVRAEVGEGSKILDIYVPAQQAEQARAMMRTNEVVRSGKVTLLE